MKKIAVFLLCLIVLSGVGLYMASDTLLAKATDKVLDYLSLNVKTSNFKYTRPVFANVRLSSWNAVTWNDVTLNASLIRNDVKTTEHIALKIAKITVSVTDFSNRTIIINAQGLSAVTKETGSGIDVAESTSRMEDGHFEMPFSLAGFSKTEVLAQLDTLKEEMRQFTVRGVTQIPISFAATERFEMQGKPYVVRFSVEPEEEGYRLVIDKDDLEKVLSARADLQPNPVEIALVARNPFRASLLLKIRDKAAETSELAARQNPKVSEDAYRHTLWSYLLTKTYGEQFAKEVTDAHEMYADEEEVEKAGLLNFSAASYQDLVNNAVGRKYAVLNYPESSILERVMTDPTIIRDNEAVQRFDVFDYEKLKPEIPNKTI